MWYDSCSMIHEAREQLLAIPEGEPIPPELITSIARAVEAAPIPFDELKSDGIPPSCARITNTLLHARDTEFPTLNQELEDLRIIRAAGSSDHQKTELSEVLDEVLIDLVRKNEDELATALLTSSPRDLTHLKNLLARFDYPQDERDNIYTKLVKLQAVKQRTLRFNLILRGADKETYETIIAQSADPDAARTSCSTDWEIYNYQKLPHEFKDVVLKEDLPSAQPALRSIIKHGMVADTDDVFNTCRRITLPADRDRYLKNAKRFLHEFDKHKDAEIIDTSWYIGYMDPLAAYEASRVIGEGDRLTGIELLNLAYRPHQDNETSHIVELISPEAVQTLSEISKLMRETGIYIGHIEPVLATPFGRAEPEAFLTTVRDSLKACEGLTGLQRIVYLSSLSWMTDHRNFNNTPQAFAVMREHFPSPLPGTGEKLINHVMQRAFFRDTLATATELVAAMHLVNDSLEEIRANNAANVISELFMNQQPPILSQETIAIAVEHVFEQLFKQLARELELDPSTTLAIHTSWQAYNAYTDLRNSTPSAVPNEYVNQMAKLKSPEAYFQQMVSLYNYSIDYGVDETRGIIDAFGIHNFTRYDHQQLHAQYEAWHANETPTKNIIMSAQDDYNHGHEFGSKYHTRTFGAEGLVYFEASSPRQVAQWIRHVGVREKKAGRTPSVNNVLFDGHGTSEEFLLKQRGHTARITADDLIACLFDQRSGNNRPNTYRQHLGESYRVIFLSCRTAKPRDNGLPTIAQALRDAHHMRVDAPAAYSAELIITDDNNVIYRNSAPDDDSPAEHAAITFPALPQHKSATRR